MPTRFLSDAEIERLEGWPESIDPDSLGRHFQLDGRDVVFVRRQNGASGQLGIALQLCALRWLGFFPDDLPAAPEEAIGCLADALDVPVRAIFDYSVRPQTRWEHRPLVREHAGFVAVSEPALAPVRGWMAEQAMEHERPSLLFSEMCAELRRRGIERPSVTEAMRHVGWARERAHEQTCQWLAPQLTDAVRSLLDLLVTEQGQSRHAWLRARPTAVRAAAMRRELEKRAFLIDTIGADRFDLSALPPNRRSWLAQTGRQQTNQALARMAPERRYPVLMAFCVEALARASDDAIEVFDRALGAADRAAQRKRDELERRGRRDIQSAVRRFVDLSKVVLQAHDTGTDVVRLVERRIGIEQLRADLDRAQGVARPAQTGYLDMLITDHGAAGRKLLARVIADLELRVTGHDEDELLAGLRLIRQLADDKRRWLPGFSPSAFIDAQWRAQVVDTGRGRLDRRGYELCAAFELRAARVWVPGSHRHADPSSLLLPEDGWQATKAEFATTVERPVDGTQRLNELADEQRQLLEALASERDTTAEAHLADGDVVLDAAEPGDDGRLRALIEPMLPEVDLPELLIEVDGWTGFTEHLVPLSGNRRRSADMPCLLYAVILAQATNLGLTGMASRTHRHGESERVQLPAARMGLGAALPRGHPHRRQRPPGRLPPRSAAHADLGRGPAVVIRWAAVRRAHPRSRSRGATALLRAPPPRHANLFVDV
jgi:hypothetical protein